MTPAGAALGREVETRRLRRRERRLQQALARKRPGSANRRKAKARLAAHKARMARKRTDVIHKVTAHLAQNHGVVAVEGLDVASMTASARGTAAAPGSNVCQKAGLNRSIMDRGWGEFTRQLRYKLGWTGGRLIEVDPAYSSQTCPTCHAVDAGNRVSREAFVCTVCGHAGHADVVAARGWRGLVHGVTRGARVARART
jgi:putative transposase